MRRNVNVAANGCDYCGGMHYSEFCGYRREVERVNYAQYPYQGAFQRGGRHNRNSGNFNFGNNGYNNGFGNFEDRFSRNTYDQNNYLPPQQYVAFESQQADPEPSLMDMMKDFIEVITKQDEKWNEELSQLNEKIDQDQRNHQGWIMDLERRLDTLSDEIDQEQEYNQLQIGEEQVNIMSSWFDWENYESEDDEKVKITPVVVLKPKYQHPPVHNEHENVILTRSGNSYNFPVDTNNSSSDAVLGKEPVEDDFSDEDEEDEQPEPVVKIPAVAPPPVVSLQLEEFLEIVEAGDDGVEGLIGELDETWLEEEKVRDSELEEFLGIDEAENDELEDLIAASDETILEKERDLDLELEKFLEIDVEDLNGMIGADYGDITMEELEKMFTEDKREDVGENRGTKRSALEARIEERILEGIDIVPVRKHKVKKNSIPQMKDKFAQVKDDRKAGSLNFNDDTNERPTRGYFKEDVLEKDYDHLRRREDGLFVRETREWNDAWVKNHDVINVLNKVLLFDVCDCRCMKGGFDMLRSWHEERSRRKLRFLH